MYLVMVFRFPELSVTVTERTPHGDERSVAGEFLYAVVAGLGDEDVSHRADTDTVGMIELTGPAAGGSPLREKNPVAGELLNAVVPGVDDVDVAVVIYLDPVRSGELAIAGSA